MASIKRKLIKEKPLDRACPACGFIVAQREIELSRFNYYCPRCKKQNLSEFVRVKLGGR